MIPWYGGCLRLLWYAVRLKVAPYVDANVALVRDDVGDRGCFLLLVSAALLALILPMLIFDLDWERWLVLGGILALFVIYGGASYRLGSGHLPTGGDWVGSVAGRAMSSGELVARHNAGERTFRDAGLRRAMLSGMDLGGVDLRGANLAEASLSGADLRSANLSGADLSGADLSEAGLHRADLAGAYMSDADLTGAKVTYVQLAKAWLQGATLPDGTVHP